MNDKEIPRLIEVLRSGEDEDARRQAADRLVKVARYNNTFAKMQKHLICRERLGNQPKKCPFVGQRQIPPTPLFKGGWGDLALVKMAKVLYNETAIAALVRLLLDFNRSRDSRREAAKIIGAIAYGNQIAIAALVELLDVSSDRDTRRIVADSLAKTVKGSKGKLEAIAALALRNDSMEQTEQTSCTIREKLPPTR